MREGSYAIEALSPENLFNRASCGILCPSVQLGSKPDMKWKRYLLRWRSKML